ncbi:MAG: hypothetical protein JJ975_05480 [Bacteroidia bacterium]|nr:hypothetical protein [Bacteroidia bacterium]
MPSIGKILLIVIAYLVIRFIGRVWKFRKVILEQRDTMMNQAQQGRHAGQEGDVSVVTPKKPKKKDLNEGSYVDFEEVD